MHYAYLLSEIWFHRQNTWTPFCIHVLRSSQSCPWLWITIVCKQDGRSSRGLHTVSSDVKHVTFVSSAKLSCLNLDRQYWVSHAGTFLIARTTESQELLIFVCICVVVWQYVCLSTVPCVFVVAWEQPWVRAYAGFSWPVLTPGRLERDGGGLERK